MKLQIVSDPKILGGKPIISGSRISVELILDRIASGMSVKEILQDYPYLISKQIQAVVSYAKEAVNRESTRLIANQDQESTTLYTHEISR